jgi:hypothetical protein
MVPWKRNPGSHRRSSEVTRAGPTVFVPHGKWNLRGSFMKRAGSGSVNGKRIERNRLDQFPSLDLTNKGHQWRPV